MITSGAIAQELAFARTKRILISAVGALVLLGLIWAKSPEQLFAYLAVSFTAILPSILWARMGAPGIPDLPVVSLAYIPYFAWPVLNGSEIALDYTAGEIFQAALTAMLFLLSATTAWRLLVRRSRQQYAIAPDRFDPSRVVNLVLIGMLVGVIFHLSVISGFVGRLGSFFGLARTIALTLVTVACFLMGVARAQKILFGKNWVLALGGTLLLVILSWSSLFLVGGVAYILAALFGYVIAARRIPWLVLAATIATVTVLHAGKTEMRDKYWDQGANYGGITSPTQLPGFAAEWIGDGFSAMTGDNDYMTPLDRTSLLQMILLVQRKTPDRIAYLEGKTYALLPAILVPRFIESDKPASQAGMDLLNIRYGLLTAEGAASTAIGWGLVAEAYANFGYLGVIGIALILGAACGGLQNWSRDASIISLPTLTCIAVMMTLINIELDFIQVCSVLLQSFASVLIFLAAFRWFAVR